MTNQDYRQINGTDTLAASAALRHLRDLGLLTQKGRGNATYYTLNSETFAQKDGKLPPPHKGLNWGASYLYQIIWSEWKSRIFWNKRSDFCALHPGRKRPGFAAQMIKTHELKTIIKSLCALGKLRPDELGKILRRDINYLKENYLYKIVKSQELEHTHPTGIQNTDSQRLIIN